MYIHTCTHVYIYIYMYMHRCIVVSPNNLFRRVAPSTSTTRPHAR